MFRRRHKNARADGVEINLAAMLDMAFQLLMFFILTFSPMPLESQIAAQLPASGTITQSMLPQSGDAGAVTVTVTVLASESGNIRDLAVDDVIVPDVQGLRQQLPRMTTGRRPCSLVLQVDARLHYQDLVHVIDACLQAEGLAERAFDKLTFVELRAKR